MESEKILGMTGGAEFRFDLEKEALVELGNVDNLILFSEMQDRRTHYELLYSPESRCIPCQMEPVENSLLIKIPQMVDLSRNGMEQKYGKLPSNIVGSFDLQYQAPDFALLMSRLDGTLPRLVIDGKVFDVDLDSMKLIGKHADNSNAIDLLRCKRYLSDERRFLPQDSGNVVIRHLAGNNTPIIDPKFTCLYDLDTGQILGTSGLSNLPKNMVELQIPNEHELDPLYLSRRNGNGIDYQFLREFPIRQPVVEIVPAHRSLLLNEARQGYSNRLNKERERKTKGKGL